MSEETKVELTPTEVYAEITKRLHEIAEMTKGLADANPDPETPVGYGAVLLFVAPDPENPEDLRSTHHVAGSIGHMAFSVKNLFAEVPEIPSVMASMMLEERVKQALSGLAEAGNSRKSPNVHVVVPHPGNDTEN
ncbi:MAG: hypothetical protein AB7C95_00830 [Synergistaceae bacterium]